MNATPIEILLVEDSPGDVALVQQGLRNGKVLNNLTVVPDGVEAMKYLSATLDGSGNSRPQLVLLDINLPRKNGHEVLKEIRDNPGLAALPVIVLTTSDHDGDILKAYQHHANAYIQKPLDGLEFITAVREIQDFWLTLVKLPSPNHSENS